MPQLLKIFNVKGGYLNAFSLFVAILCLFHNLFFSFIETLNTVQIGEESNRACCD